MEFTAVQFVELGIAIVFLALGFLLAVVAVRALKFDNNTVLAALIVVPVIIYLLISGRLTDFSAFGIEAKFKSEAGRAIGKIAIASDLAVSNEEANEGNFSRDALWQECRPYILVTPENVPDSNSPAFASRMEAVANVLRSSILCNRLLAVVVLDERDKVIGFFEPALFLETLRIPLVRYGATSLPDVETELRMSELGVVLSNPIRRAESPDALHLFLSENMDAVSALKRMQDASLNVAVVTNSAGEFRGVMSRQVAAESILGAVTKALSSSGTSH
ncbi:MAG: hypothetical protein ABJ215_15690 [Alphaproteobacteria bacterium]